MSRKYFCPYYAYSSIVEPVNETFFLVYRVEDAPSSLAPNSLAPAKQDGAIGSEQRVFQSPTDSITREAKIAMKKKVDMKKKTGTTYRKMNAQMVSDPPGETNNSTYHPLRYSTTVQI